MQPTFNPNYLLTLSDSALPSNCNLCNLPRSPFGGDLPSNQLSLSSNYLSCPEKSERLVGPDLYLSRLKTHVPGGARVRHCEK